MIREEKIVSIFGSPYEMYFENGCPHPAGDLLAAGIGLPTQRNVLWDTRELWSYPYYNLSIILGDGIASYRNERGFQCELSSGIFFFTFPDLKQQYAPAIGEPWGELYVSFAGAIFDAIRDEETFTPQQPLWRLAEPQPWIERLQTLLQTPAPSTPQQSLGRAVHFLGYLLKMLEEATPIQTLQSDADWFSRACKMLTGDLHHKVDLKLIADSLEMSYHTFRIYFTRRAGVSPMRYRDDARLKAACGYLANAPVKPCHEIAFILGYANPQHFCEQFKKQTGASPNEYRQKHRKR